MIFQTVNHSEFQDAFKAMRPDQFSYAALCVMFDYFDEFENYHLDVIAICCEWEEFDSIEDVALAYDDVHCIEDLYEMTLVLEMDNGSLVVQLF